MQAHKARARELGRKLVDAERDLDALFKAKTVDERELATHVQRVATLQGEYRLAHLDTHRKMRLLLSAAQVAQYGALRGYGDVRGHAPHAGGH